MNEKNIFDTGTATIRVKEVDYLGDKRLRLRFNDQKQGVVDLSDFIASHPLYAALNNEKSFIQFGLEHGTLVWENNLDVAPEWLYRHCH